MPHLKYSYKLYYLEITTFLTKTCHNLPFVSWITAEVVGMFP